PTCSRRSSTAAARSCRSTSTRAGWKSIPSRTTAGRAPKWCGSRRGERARGRAATPVIAANVLAEGPLSPALERGVWGRDGSSLGGPHVLRTAPLAEVGVPRGLARRLRAHLVDVLPPETGAGR